METKTWIIGTAVAVLVVSLFVLFPRWNVYRQELRGKAALRED